MRSLEKFMRRLFNGRQDGRVVVDRTRSESEIRDYPRVKSAKQPWEQSLDDMDKPRKMTRDDMDPKSYEYYFGKEKGGSNEA